MTERRRYINPPIETIEKALCEFRFDPEPVAQPVVADDRRSARLAMLLRAAFETDPLENGIDHPAESLIADALAHAGRPQALEWMRDFSLDTSDPTFAASVLRCLGRIDRPGTTAWRAALIGAALNLDEVQMRDAAAQAAESWADRCLAEVLAAHDEPEPWLRQYVADVVNDLRARNDDASSSHRSGESAASLKRQRRTAR